MDGWMDDLISKIIGYLIGCFCFTPHLIKNLPLFLRGFISPPTAVQHRVSLTVFIFISTAFSFFTLLIIVTAWN